MATDSMSREFEDVAVRAPEGFVAVSVLLVVSPDAFVVAELEFELPFESESTSV